MEDIACSRLRSYPVLGESHAEQLEQRAWHYGFNAFEVMNGYETLGWTVNDSNTFEVYMYGAKPDEVERFLDDIVEQRRKAAEEDDGFEKED